MIPDDTNPDGSPSPGAGPARVVDYIDRLLAVFDDDVPFIFAGGPASDRNPEPAAALCGDDIPPNGPRPNEFLDPVPLSRRQEIAWRAKILGTAALGAEGDFLRANNKALGTGDANGDVPGLQEIYRQGVRSLDALREPALRRETSSRSRTFRKTSSSLADPDQGFVDTLFAHAVEGMYANPEYGGNQPPDRSRPATGADGDNRPLGWSYLGFEGDRQPLGYTIFDPSTESYCEIAAHPMSAAQSRRGPRAARRADDLGCCPQDRSSALRLRR